ncbi:MAG: glycosyltransferase [Gammaproteobacteria bacterium]
MRVLLTNFHQGYGGEMMSMGLPIIVSDYAGLPENIDTEKNGWIIPIKNVDALKACMMKIMTKADVAKMGANAREKAIQLFSNDAFIKNTVAFYQEVIT